MSRGPSGVHRGAVYAARLGVGEGSEQAGTRPVVVVSNDEFNEVMPVVTVVPATTYRGRRVYPSEVLVRRGDSGFRSDSLLLAHQIRTIARARLGRIIGQLDGAHLAALDHALRVHLDLFS